MSKKTEKIEAELRRLATKQTEAKAAVAAALKGGDEDEAAARLPKLRAAVEVTAQRVADTEKELHAAQIEDATKDIERAKTAFAETIAAYQKGKDKHLAEMLATHEKPSIGKKIGKDRKLWPEWLTALQKTRHDAHANVMEAYRALYAIDKAAAAALGWSPIDNTWTGAPVPGPTAEL